MKKRAPLLTQRASSLFFNKLLGVKAFEIEAQGRRGVGSVALEVVGLTRVVFHEKGQWEDTGARFRNKYLWELDEELGRIRLSHDRNAFVAAETFLIEFKQAEEGVYEAVQEHECGQDRYGGCIREEVGGFRLVWDIDKGGQRQRVEIVYFLA